MACWLLAALTLGAPARSEEAVPAPPPAQEPPGNASLVGKVLDANGEAPIAGAVVRICYLEGDLSLASDPTGAKGEYEVLELPPGYADVTVETRDGLFLANQVLSFQPKGRIVAEFLLRKPEGGSAKAPAPAEPRSEPVCGARSFAGTAEIAQKKSTGQFLRSPAGIAIIAGGAGLLLLVAASGDDETPVSPSVPP